MTWKIRCGNSAALRCQSSPILLLFQCVCARVRRLVQRIYSTPGLNSPTAHHACPPASPRNQNTTTHPAPQRTKLVHTSTFLLSQACPPPEPNQASTAQTRPPLPPLDTRHQLGPACCPSAGASKLHPTHATPGTHPCMAPAAVQKKYSTLLQHPSAIQPQTAVVFGILCVVC